MKTGKKGKDLIKRFESLHDGDLSMIGLQPKMCPAGIWTEGWGRAMRDAKGNFIKGKENKNLAYSRISIRTEAEAETALDQDLQVFERIVTSKLKRLVSQEQFDALVSHTYNTGGSKTLFELVNDMNTTSDKLKAWWETHYVIGGGVKLAGLERRRKAEYQLYIS